MSTGIELISAERKRQIEVEGWTPEHDDEVNHQGSLALAAVSYALPETVEPLYWEVQNKTGVNLTIERKAFWPWPKSWWKPGPTRKPEHRIRELIKAGALIAAEIDRLQRFQNNAE